MFFHPNQKDKQSFWWLAEGSNENCCFLHKGCHALQIVQFAEKLPPLARADVQGCVKNETNTHLFLGYIQYTSLLSTAQGIHCDHCGVL